MRGDFTYAGSGVDIDAGERAVTLMRSAVERTRRPEVVGGLGGFAGLFALDTTRYRRPLIASSTDGVGTKLAIAQAIDKHDTVGIDLVGMVVDDLVVCGAEPLFLQDYIAVGKVVPAQIATIVKGIADGCQQAGCALLGGETAEMPGLYAGGDLDVVGACVGACERAGLVSGERVRAGDAILGLASSGLHTNGYTLARKVVEDAGLSYSGVLAGFDRSLGEVYLEPHRAYAREVAALRDSVEVRGMAHITGGGLTGNLPRALGGLGARLDASSWKEPPVFALFRDLGNVPEDEMRRVFNLGVGFCVVVPAGEAEKGLDMLHGAGCAAWRIGEVVERGGVEFA